MSIDKCLKNGVDGGELTPAQAKQLKTLYENILKQKARDGTATAEVRAKVAAIRELEMEQLERKRRLARTIKAVKDIDARLGNNVADNAIAHLEHFGDGFDGYSFSSIEGRRKAIIGRAHEMMGALLHDFRRGALTGDKGRHNKARLDNVVREAFGEDTGDEAAKGLAKAWQQTHEWLRRRFNDAGGAIGKLENWGLPQSHDARALRRAGPERWKATIKPLLDASRMKHHLTGEPLTDAQLDETLSHVWDSIVTEGWNTREPKRQRFGKGSIASQHAEERFLIFNDAKSWVDYQRAFGEGDPFSAMMTHINRLARDISAMEILGPNPDGMIEWLKQTITKEAKLKEAGKASRFKGNPDKAARRIRKLETMWAAMRGTLETPINQKFADTMAVGRNWITASVLGSAALSSVSDIATQIMARHFAGVPALRIPLDIISQFSLTSRRDAIAAGLILDSAQHSFHGQARYAGTIEGPAWSSYLVDRVLTWSGLTPWTQATRHAFGMATMREFGELAGRDFANLPEGMQRLMIRYGMGEREWDVMRQAELYRPHGDVPMLRPREIAAADERLAERFLEMVLQETEYATPGGSVRSKTFLVSSQPGTLHGEVQRSFAQFKSFGAVFAMMHGQRIAAMLGTPGLRPKGAAYAGALFVTTTMFGALALQLKQIAAGRDPRDMSNKEFWGASVLQGGGLGLYGDFLFSDLNRYGGGLMRTLAGPTVERINDAWNLTAGNIAQGVQGEKTNFGRELVKFMRGNTPGGTIWYVRQAYERVLLDQLQFLIDPEANKAFKRQQRNWDKNFGQEFYWRPGEVLPARSPDFSAAFGG
jgi:hypothetical protein